MVNQSRKPIPLSIPDLSNLGKKPMPEPPQPPPATCPFVGIPVQQPDGAIQIIKPACVGGLPCALHMNVNGKVLCALVVLAFVTVEGATGKRKVHN